MYHYWGKASKTDATAYHLLVYHCLDVGAVLTCLLDADPFLKKRLRMLSPTMDWPHQKALLVYFAVLHDLGKFAPTFQLLRPDLAQLLGVPSARLATNAHHTSIGFAIFENLRSEASFPPFDCPHAGERLKPLAEAAFGHHGRPPLPLPGRLRLPNVTQEAVMAFARETADLLVPPDCILPPEDTGIWELRQISWLYAGLLVLADWIASGIGFPYVATPYPLTTYWNDHALPQARIAVAGCGVLPPRCSPSNDFHALLPHMKEEYAPTPLQRYAMATAGTGNGPRLFLFEDVTGAGKTEAALLAAHAIMEQGEAESFYIGLPTMATANGMYARLCQSYRALFEKTDDASPSLMLAHSARGIHDAFLSSIGLEQTIPSDSDESEEEGRESGAFCAAWLADNRKKALLAPCGVGTLDQALLAVLPAKHQCLRLLGLGRSVLIADEVHAYDDYSLKILEALLTFQAGLGGSAILLSATLPQRFKQSLAAAFCHGAGYAQPELTAAALPVATRIAADGCQETCLPQTRHIDMAVTLTHDADQAFDQLLAVHAAGGCAILICNTVDRAVDAHSRLAEHIPKADLILFHARFALCDRLAIEEHVLSIFGKESTRENRQGKILVASQVVEQSLDIDGDFLVTELAPMELMLQRLGRCQRHARQWRPAGFTSPRLCIIAPEAVDVPTRDWGKAELGKGLFVYPARGILWRTARLLAARERIELPADARALVEGAYDEEALPTPEALVASDQEKEGADRAKASLAQSNVLLFEQGYGSEAAAGGGWYDDRIVPTRLGMETVRLRLVRIVDEGLELWAGPGLDAATCARSEVSVPVWRVKDLAPDEAWQERLDAFAASLPDKCRWTTLVPFAATNTPGYWRCVLPGAHLAYSQEQGLQFSEDKGRE